MFKCKYCDKEFEKSTAMAGHISHCEKNPNKDKNCKSWQNSFNKISKTIKEKNVQYKQLHPEKYIIQEYKCNCEKCGKEYVINVTQDQFEKGMYKKRCSSSCAHSRIHTNETKEKISKSTKLSAHKKLRICKCCGKQYTFIKGITTKMVCSKECSEYMRTHRKEFLSEDTIKKLSEAGKKAANNSFNLKRSKAEIYFANLCKNKYNNVLTNERIFNGWDADIILPDFKIAVLYNGKWHYEEISKKVSLAQIQNRDKIKIKEIENCNYVPYIIKDLNKFNKEFVEEQFKIFSNYIDNLNKETLDTK